MSAVGEIVDRLIASGMLPAEAAVLVAQAVIEGGGRGVKSARPSRGASRMADYRDRREALGMPRIFDASKFLPLLKQRDGHRCIYCEATDDLVIDHIFPIFLGGNDDDRNLGFACRPCNGKKAGRTLSDAGMKITVESAKCAHEGYKPRTVCAPNDNGDRRTTVRETAHTGAQNRAQPNSDLLSIEGSLVDSPKEEPKKTRKKDIARGTQLPEDWSLDQIDIAFAGKHGMSHPPTTEFEAERFKAFHHAKSGADALKSNWHAAWRTWVLNWVKFGSSQRARNGPAPNGDPRGERGTDWW